MYNVRLRSRDRFRAMPIDEPDDEHDAVDGTAAKGCSSSSEARPPRKRTASFRNSFNEFIDFLKPRNKSKERENKPEFTPKLESFVNSKRNYLRTCVYGPPLTPFPNWVYEMYDPRILVNKIHDALASLKLFSQMYLNVPKDPVELSFWVATNFPLSNVHRLKLLEMNCCIQRLRWELCILRHSQALVCRNCSQVVAHQEDVFSMSQGGPQAAYVNSHGYVHETLTLFKAQNLNLRGQPSTQDSWFPGYAWTIAECKHCGGHMGWKFTATNRRLVPRKFWGISRQSIRSLVEVDKGLDRGVGQGIQAIM